MAKARKWPGWLVAGLGVVAAILLALWRAFRRGAALGKAKEQHDDEAERLKGDRAEVRRAGAEGDGGGLYRRGREWTRKNQR